MWKFIIRKNAQAKIDYLLKDGSGRVILHSGVYSSDNACRKGIASVTRNSRTENIEDYTGSTEVPLLKHPKYEIYRAQDGKYWFQLKATNGQVVGLSSSFASRENCLEVLESLREHGHEAIVDD